MPQDKPSQPRYTEFDGSDLLAELAGEATQKSQAQQSNAEMLRLRSEALHDALNRIFKYFDLFTNHVNKLHPGIPRTYGWSTQTEFKNLKWVDSFADSRKQSLSDTAYLDEVFLRIKLSSPAPVQIKRWWHQMGALKKNLHAYGLRSPLDLDDLLREKPQQEVFQLELAPDFQINMRFQGNYNTGLIDLRCHNLEDFGVTAFTFEPSAVTPQLMDELGRFLLGRNTGLPESLLKSRNNALLPAAH
ncbi:MAG: hypothetical protein PHI29_07010 [Gallionella sp.]|nr:hypothetical protein [Gallionella sp.]